MLQAPRALSIALLLLVIPTAGAEPLFSVPEFKLAIRRCVATNPDLTELWSSRGPYPSPILVGGSDLQWLMQWMIAQIRSGAMLSGLCQSSASPPLSNLRRMSSSDHDLLYNGTWAPVQRIQDTFPPAYRDWDYLKQEFYQQSLLAGGTPLDKIWANPETVLDEMNALEDLSAGRIRFINVSESQFLPQRGANAVFRTNTKTALVLRTLRASVLYGLRIEPADQAQMLAAVRYEVQNGLIPQEFASIQKAVNKLYKSTHEDLARTRALLSSVELGLPLARLGYVIEDDTGAMFSLIDTSGWSTPDLLGMKGSGSAKWLEYCVRTLVSRSQSVEELMVALTPVQADPVELDQLYAILISEYDRLVRLKPTRSQLNRLSSLLQRKVSMRNRPMAPALLTASLALECNGYYHPRQVASP